jgi:hypothetical protein
MKPNIFVFQHEILFANKNYAWIIHQYALSDFLSGSPLSLGRTVEQLVEALRYKPEGCNFEWDFFLS